MCVCVYVCVMCHDGCVGYAVAMKSLSIALCVILATLSLLEPVYGAGPDKNYCSANGNAGWTCKAAWAYCCLWFVFWLGIAFYIKGRG